MGGTKIIIKCNSPTTGPSLLLKMMVPSGRTLNQILSSLSLCRCPIGAVHLSLKQYLLNRIVSQNMGSVPIGMISDNPYMNTLSHVMHSKEVVTIFGLHPKQGLLHARVEQAAPDVNL